MKGRLENLMYYRQGKYISNGEKKIGTWINSIILNNQFSH